MAIVTKEGRRRGKNGQAEPKPRGRKSTKREWGQLDKPRRAKEGGKAN